MYMYIKKPTHGMGFSQFVITARVISPLILVILTE